MIRLAENFLPWAAGCALLCLIAGLYQALWTSPADYQQGETVRIMYVHVPCAWLAMGLYGFIGTCSLYALIKKSSMSHILIQSAAPLGAIFTALSLVTGALWGKPMWGTWWVWDARLTSVLILFFLYAGYLVLTQDAQHDGTILQRGALLNVMGLINLPLIKWSVNWWNTLHQPASLTIFKQPALPPEMIWPLLTMTVAFIFLSATFFLMNVCGNLYAQKRFSLHLRQKLDAAPSTYQKAG